MGVEKHQRVPGIEPGDSLISYTQFSMYQNCPHSWELAYARKLRTKEPTINLMFGTAMHNTIQDWLTTMYGDSGSVVKLNEQLQLNMEKSFDEMVTEWGKPFSSIDEIEEFYEDGVEILRHLKKDRLEYYNTDESKLHGIEVPILVTPVDEKPTVKLIGYLDVVLSLLDDKHFIIQDLKTSTNGWTDYQMRDRTKVSQLLLYKYYFGKQYNVRVQDITVQYIILRRKSKNKLQIFIPKQTNPALKSIVDELKEFVNTAFDDSGKVRLDIEYPAVSGYGNEKCRFCEFKDRLDLCPVSNRIPDIELAKQ